MKKVFLPFAVLFLLFLSSTAANARVHAAKKKLAESFNNSYLITNIGALRAELEEVKTGLAAGKNYGYDAGFVLKSPDDKYKLNINGRIQGRYSVNFAEDVQDGHSLLFKRLQLMFSGNAINEKLTYLFQLDVKSSPSLVVFDFGYDFSPQFAAHIIQDSVTFSAEVTQSSDKLMFVNSSLFAVRYDFGPTIGVLFSGEVGWFSYVGGVYNSIQDLGFKANQNNEMGYTFRADFNAMGELSPGDSDVLGSENPALVFGVAGLFGHYEEATQARVMAGTGDVRFKYHGFAAQLAAVIRQTDLDQFTPAQYDVAFAGQAGYFVVPHKLEIAARSAILMDDINDAGVNLQMDADFDTGMDGALSGGDVDEDSDNEWEATLGVNYYIVDYNVKVQGQYSVVVDGIVGPDDRVYHIGMVQFQLGF